MARPGSGEDAGAGVGSAFPGVLEMNGLKGNEGPDMAMLRTGASSAWP